MITKLGIIGHPIGHTMSPVLHKAALDYYNLNSEFNTWDVKPGALCSFVKKARNLENGIIGFSVTVPHKEAIIPMLDGISNEALSAGAVNMVSNQDGQLFGCNTGGLGFLRSIFEKAEFNLKDKKVLILGAGGAARGVISIIKDEGIYSIAIANRTIERAQKLLVDLDLDIVSSKVVELGSLEMHRIACDSDLIVQCTTVGMLGGSEPSKSLLKAESISDKSLVYDLVYNPKDTPLLMEAKNAGAKIMSGMWMLVYQGAIAFEKWTSREAPLEVMFRATEGSFDS